MSKTQSHVNFPVLTRQQFPVRTEFTTHFIYTSELSQKAARRKESVPAPACMDMTDTILKQTNKQNQTRKTLLGLSYAVKAAFEAFK